MNSNNGNKRILLVVLCTVLLCSLLLPCFASAEGETADRAVRVGWYDDGLNEEPGAATGAHGYDYEYLQAIAQYTGWTYEYVAGSWDECVQWLKEGKIDLLSFVHKTPEREEYFAYTQLPMAVSSGVLVCGSSSSIASVGVETLRGKRVGIFRGNAYNADFEAYRQKNGFDVKYVEYDNLSEISPALESGEIDVAVIADEDKTASERVLLKLSTRNQYFATGLGNTELLSELDSAMVQVNTYCPYLNSDLYQKYLSLSSDGKPIFTVAEQNFIFDNPNILVMYDSGWPPIEYYDSETQDYVGISPDLFDLLSEKCGLSFVYEGSTSGQVLSELQNDGDRNVLTTISYDYSWADKHNVYITQPFITSNIVMLGHNFADPDAKVAINEKAYFTYVLKDELVGKNTQHYAKQAERLEAVRTGQADYTFVTEDQANYYRSIPKYSSLQTEKMMGYEQKVCISITKNSDPELLSVISKALASVTHDEMTAIVRKNTENTYKPTFWESLASNWYYIVTVIALIFAVIALAFYFSARMKADKARGLAASQANRAKSDFLSHVSHDIRTPLNAIIGMTALAIEEPDNVVKQDYLLKVNESGKYLLGLINDTLDMSKIESGKLNLHFETANFDEVCEIIMAIIGPKAEEKHLKLSVEKKNITSRYIMTDKLRLEQILLNLLNNAVKFTPENGAITFTIEAIERSDEEVTYRMTVADTGIGMSEEFMKKLFQPFEQERNRLSVENAGTGLGLSIVKSLVDMMGGSVTCKSKKDVGTTFTVELTSRYATPEEISVGNRTALPLDDAIFEGKRVLVAEDNSMNTLVEEKMLEKKNIIPVCVKNGREAVEAFENAEKGYFDAVLMDIHMPEMDGLAATRAIRALNHPDGGTVPIIALSANAYDEDRKECIAAGMNDHVAKPIEAEQLYSALKRAFVGKKPE